MSWPADPDYVFWDIELWQEGGDDGLTGRCKRCKDAITASGKPAAEFLKDAGTEIFRDTYNAVKAASVEGKFPMPLVARLVQSPCSRPGAPGGVRFRSELPEIS